MVINAKTLEDFQVGDIVAFYGLSGDMQTHNPKRIIFSNRLKSLACQNRSEAGIFFNKTEKEQGFLFGSLDDCFIPPAHSKIGKIGYQNLKEKK